MPNTIEVLITLSLPEELVAQLRGISPRLKISVYKARKVEEIPVDVWARTEILYTANILPTPEQAPRLHWIQFHWAGIDHAIQAPIVQKPDVIITTLSGAGATKLAEYGVLMLLALGHRLPDLIAYQKRAEWPKDRWNRFAPLELRNSTVGIVGYGSIGRQISRLLQEFGATVLATKRDPMHPEDTGFVPEGQGDPQGDLIYRLYPHQALHSMLKESDFVIVTVPLTPETRNLLGAEEFAAMKHGAFLIDISRGGVVNHSALIAALKDKKLAGAALDVYPEEPLPADSILWKMPNVILTPHISGVTTQYDDRAMDLFAENLHRYLANLPLYNRVNKERGY